MERILKKRIDVNFFRLKKEEGGAKWFRQYKDSDLGINFYDENLIIKERDDDVESTTSEIDEATIRMEQALAKEIKKKKRLKKLKK